MSNFFETIDKFQESKSKSFIWSTGGALFLSCVGLIYYIFSEMGNQNAEIAKLNALSHTYEMDERKVTIIEKSLTLIWDAALKVDTEYVSHITENKDIDYLSDSMVSNALAYIEEVKSGINAGIGVLSATQFDDSKFDPFVEGFQKDLDVLNEIITNKQTVYKLVQQHDYNKALEVLNKLNESPDDKIEQQLRASEIRIMGFEDLAQRKKDEHEADLNAGKEKLKGYEFKMYLLFPACFFIGFFAIYVWRVWKKEKSHSPQNVENKSSASKD